MTKEEIIQLAESIVEELTKPDNASKIANALMQAPVSLPEVKAHPPYVATREVDCAHCRLTGHCQVTFEYTEGGKIKSANVTKLDDGWEYRPFGNAGGSAPYCPKCLAQMES